MKTKEFKAMALLGIASGLCLCTEASVEAGESYLAAAAATPSTVQHACKGKGGCPSAKAGCSSKASCKESGSCGSVLTAERDAPASKKTPYDDPNTDEDETDEDK